MGIVSNDMPYTAREDSVTRKDKATFPTILHPIETPAFFPSSPTIYTTNYQCMATQERRNQRGGRGGGGRKKKVIWPPQGKVHVKRKSSFGYKDEIGLGLVGGARF